MADMSRKTPPRMDLTDWRAKVPEAALKAAEKLGPPDWDPHTETPEQARERLARQAAGRAARWHDALPVMYRHASLDDLGTDVMEPISHWLDAEGTTLMLAGQVGTGKTHAAYAVGHYLVADGVWVEAFTLSDLLAAMRPEGDNRLGVLARQCDVLILDDLGAAKASEWAQEQITALLDARLREHKRQVVTTNAPYEALAESWGSRAMDRLRYRWVVVTFTGESRRRAAW